jgi:hypothetical protein
MDSVVFVSEVTFTDLLTSLERHFTDEDYIHVHAAENCDVNFNLCL